jgi:hypothetical protein
MSALGSLQVGSLLAYLIAFVIGSPPRIKDQPGVSAIARSTGQPGNRATGL